MWAQQTNGIAVGVTQDIGIIDPARAVLLDELNNLWVNIYDMLVIRDKNGGLKPHLAQSWRNVSPTTWEFKLLKGVRFHNGEPFNAQAVKFTADRYREQGKQRYGALAQVLQNTEVVDDYTVRITTPSPDGVFIQQIWEMPILPPNYLRQVGDEGFLRRPVGTGPYRWVEWVKGNHYTIEANPTYWMGPPAVKRATFKLMPEVAVRINALKAKEVDIALQFPPDMMDEVSNSGDLRVSVARTPRVIYFEFYPDSVLGGGKPLTNRKVRQALNHGVNVDNIIKFILHDQANRVATLYAPQTYGYDKSLKPYEYDPDRAKALLKEAGYPNGFQIDVHVPTGGNPLKPVEVGQAVAADLGKVGIRVNLRSLDAATYAQLKFQYKLAPILLWNWLAFDGDYILWGNVYSKSPWFDYPGHTPQVDQWIDAERATTDQKERAQIFQKLQANMKLEAPYLPLYQQNVLFGVNKRLIWDAIPGEYLFLRTVRLGA